MSDIKYLPTKHAYNANALRQIKEAGFIPGKTPVKLEIKNSDTNAKLSKYEGRWDAAPLAKAQALWLPDTEAGRTAEDNLRKWTQRNGGNALI